jgi:hypothetical protein
MENIEEEIINTDIKIYFSLNKNYNIISMSIQKYQGFEYELIVKKEEYEELLKNFTSLKYVNNKIIIDKELENVNLLKQQTQSRIYELKLNLEKTDYKIIKCYEAFMRQQTLPYNLEELITQRDVWRAEINEIEQELSSYE